jgi:hypothetical protein
MDKLDPNRKALWVVCVSLFHKYERAKQDRGGVVYVSRAEIKSTKLIKKAHAVVEWLTFAGYCPWPRKNWSVFLLGISGHRPY